MKSSTNTDLVIMTEYFPPDVAPTGQLLHDLVVELHASFRVRSHVLTSQPHYKKDADPAPRLEKMPWGVIQRVPALTSSRHSILSRIKGFAWNFFAFVTASHSLPKAKAMIVSSNPPTLPLVAALHARMRGQSFRVLIDDIYPNIASVLGVIKKDGITETLWRRSNAAIYSQAQGVITLGNYMKAVLNRMYPDTNIDVAPYWAPPEIQPIAKSESHFAKAEGFSDTFVVLYSGNHGRLHNLEQLIELASMLKDEAFTFVFVGDGAKRETIKRMAEQRALPNVCWHPYQPLEKLPDVLAAADLSVVCLAKDTQGLAVPSKLWGIMASARPVLALAEQNCEIAETVVQARCGHVITAGDALDKSANLLRHWQQHPQELNAMGQRGRAYQQEHHAINACAGNYARILSFDNS